MADQLTGHWRHSHEEDEANGIAVFRPIAFPFPPSRGRAEFELLPDGHACFCAVGRGDQLQKHPCYWHIDFQNNGPFLIIDDSNKRLLVAQLISCHRNQLRIRYRDDYPDS
jgi:hypothetical protein